MLQVLLPFSLHQFFFLCFLEKINIFASTTTRLQSPIYRPPVGMQSKILTGSDGFAAGLGNELIKERVTNVKDL